MYTSSQNLSFWHICECLDIEFLDFWVLYFRWIIIFNFICYTIESKVSHCLSRVFAALWLLLGHGNLLTSHFSLLHFCKNFFLRSSWSLEPLRDDNISHVQSNLWVWMNHTINELDELIACFKICVFNVSLPELF